MKRVGRILSVVVIFVILSFTTCFAAEGTFNLESTYPVDGATGTTMENMSVKLYFDTEFTEEILKKSNDNAFVLTDPDGNKLPTKVLYSPKEKGVVLVLLDNTSESSKDVTIKGNTVYSLKILGTLKDNEGNVLGKEHTVSFKTVNQSFNMMVNMLLMFVMFGGMMVITTRSAKKQAEEQAKKKEEKVNPYKEAKRTGKSVESIVEKDQRDKAKRAEKEAKRLAEEEEYEAYFTDNYRVKGPKPISAAGGKYTTGRKAEAEARKAEAEAKKAQKKVQATKRKTKKK